MLIRFYTTVVMWKKSMHYNAEARIFPLANQTIIILNQCIPRLLCEREDPTHMRHCQVVYLLGAALRDTAALNRWDKVSVSLDVTQNPYWFCHKSIFSPPQPPVPLWKGSCLLSISVWINIVYTGVREDKHPFLFFVSFFSTNFCKQIFCCVLWNVSEVVKNFNAHHWSQ